MKYKIIPLIFAMILLIGIVSALGQQTINIASGYTIKIPQINNLERGMNYTFNFHVTNISNGVPIDNSSTTCQFHLEDKYGNSIVQLNATHEKTNVVNEWDALVVGGNFSYLSEYTYSIQCNSSVNNIGGIESSSFNVIAPTTNNNPLFGIDFSLFQNSVIFVVLFGVAIVFLFFRKFTFSGFIFVLAGTLMAFNGINLVICLIVMGIGVFLVSGGSEE